MLAKHTCKSDSLFHAILAQQQLYFAEQMLMQEDIFGTCNMQCRETAGVLR